MNRTSHNANCLPRSIARRHISSSIHLVAIVGLLLGAQTRFAAAAPITLSGWNANDIVAANAVTNISNTSAMNSWNFYQHGLPDGNNNQGFPADNSGVLSPAATTGTVFQFAPYTSNNTEIVSGVNSASLSLVTPGPYQSLQFLDVIQGNTTSWDVTLHFAGGSTATTPTYTDSDWVNGPTNTNGTDAFTTYGLVGVGGLSTFYGNYLFAAEHDYTLSPADQVKTLQSITINNLSGANLALLATSGVVGTPEPSSFVLCGLGALGLIIAARRSRQA